MGQKTNIWMLLLIMQSSHPRILFIQGEKEMNKHKKAAHWFSVLYLQVESTTGRFQLESQTGKGHQEIKVEIDTALDPFFQLKTEPQPTGQICSINPLRVMRELSSSSRV